MSTIAITRASRNLIIIAMMSTVSLGVPAKEDAAAIENGRKLVVEAKCEACHVSKVGGDGSSIYTRKDRRVTTLAKLQPQVSRCSTDLNLGLFPDDEAAIAAYLNSRHYKFKE